MGGRWNVLAIALYLLLAGAAAWTYFKLFSKHTEDWLLLFIFYNAVCWLAVIAAYYPRRSFANCADLDSARPSERWQPRGRKAGAARHRRAALILRFFRISQPCA